MSLINYGETEKAIKQIEQFLKDYDLEEKLLILKFLNQRLVAVHQQQRVNESIQNMPLKGLMKRFMKSEDKEEEDD